MTRPAIFLFLILIVSIGHAQSPRSGDSSGPSADGNTRKRIGRIELPPEKQRPIMIPKVSAAITIDGLLNEDAWKDAAVFKDFIQVAPGDNTPPSKRTEAYMMYDEHFLYLGFKCWDDKDKIRATVAQRDDIFGEDNVRVWLDTYDDQRRAYVLGFNPYGIQQDGIFTEGGMGADFSVDIVMESKGVIQDWGWSVEVKIPFKSLRYSAGKGKFWGFNVARNIDRNNDELDAWLPDDRNIAGKLVKHGRIGGLDGIKYERTLEIVPSVTVSETGELKRDPVIVGGRFVNGPVKAEVGVNLKFTLSPNVTLDATVNPDFAEIEADAPVITANQRFPIFFEEKRPFFLEGKDIFESPLQTFYSRSIVDPDYAVKLSGKAGKTSFGFLAASDKAPGNYTEDDRRRNSQCRLAQQSDPTIQCPLDEFIDKNALFSVVRVKRDFGDSNNIGFFGTSRIFPRDRNFTAGIDGTYKLNSKTVMQFQAVGTHSRKDFYSPETDRFSYRTGNGFGYLWGIDYTTDTHGWFVQAKGRTRDYRADAGFTNRVDTNGLFFMNRLSTKSNPNGRLVRVNTTQLVRYDFDWNGRLQSTGVQAGLNLQFSGNFFVDFEAGDSLEKLYEDEFGPKRNSSGTMAGAFSGQAERSSHQPMASVNFSKNLSKRMSVGGFLGHVWGAFDYDFGAGQRYPRVSPTYLTWVSGGMTGPYPALDPGRGGQTDIGLELSLKPTDAFSLSLEYSNSQLRRYDTGKIAFDSNIYTLRSTYQFTRFTFIRARIDYDTLRNRTAGQFLFGWSPHPGTAFYAGYNDDMNYRGYNRFTQNYTPGFERNSRTFFIRASYLFRKSF